MLLLFVRLAVLFGILWLGYKLGLYLTQAVSTQKACSGCDGKGYWLSVREREFCKECNGTGLVEK